MWSKYLFHFVLIVKLVPRTNPTVVISSESIYHQYQSSYCSYLSSTLVVSCTYSCCVFHSWQSPIYFGGDSADIDLCLLMPASTLLAIFVPVAHCAKYTGTIYYPSEHQPIQLWKTFDISHKINGLVVCWRGCIQCFLWVRGAFQKHLWALKSKRS